MKAALFDEMTVRGLHLPNRIMVSPMCQYSAVDGTMGSWHLAHLGSMALSGAGIVVVEATAVRPDGRISPGDSGLYSDANEVALQGIVDHLRAVSPAKIGLQIGHAGRKASAKRPWEGSGTVPIGEGGWQTVAPSPIAFGRNPAPEELSAAEIAELTQAFVKTAERAARIGFDYLELHGAHGYLLSEFLSPLANKRTDQYGGSTENRNRFPLEIVAAVRAVWPADRPLSMRINGSDFTEGGWTADDAAAFACAAKERGLDMVTVSGGGVDPAQKIDVKPGYQVDFARTVKARSGLPTVAVGMILSPRQAEDIITSGSADIVALARGMLFDPRWPYHAAAVLGAHIAYPPQYERAQPENWPGADFMLRGFAAPSGDN